MSLQAIDLLWSLCSQTSVLMIICICSHSPALHSLPQLHLRSSGIRFSYGAHNLDPSHAQFTVGFVLLWASNAAPDLTGGRAQAVMRVMESGYKYRWSFAHSPAAHLLLCGPVASSPVQDPCLTALQNFVRTTLEFKNQPIFLPSFLLSCIWGQACSVVWWSCQSSLAPSPYSLTDGLPNKFLARIIPS